MKEQLSFDIDDIIKGLTIRGIITHYEPYIPAKLSGHPDYRTPAEGGYAEYNLYFITYKEGQEHLIRIPKEVENIIVENYESIIDDAIEECVVE
jgi:hypothetical protein